MNFWTGLILGIIIGWLVEWIIDWLFWRRDAEESAKGELLEEGLLARDELDVEWESRLAETEMDYQSRLRAVEEEWQSRLNLNEQQWQSQFSALEQDNEALRGQLAAGMGAAAAVALDDVSDAEFDIEGEVDVDDDIDVGIDAALDDPFIEDNWDAAVSLAEEDADAALTIDLAAAELAAEAELEPQDLDMEWLPEPLSIDVETGDLGQLGGIDSDLAERLHLAGIETLDDLAAADPTALSVSTGLEREEAGEWIGRAAALLPDAELPPQTAAAAQPDDLTRIHGIGPKYAALLNEGDIHSFNALAEATPDQLRDIIRPSAMQQINFDSWRAQAATLANMPLQESAGDDLTELEGIGPVYAGKLRERGITSFAELAAADEETLAGIINAPAWRRINYGEWIAQAERAAAGDVAGLRALQDQLFKRGGDNLTLIHGMGERSATALQAAGINSFSTLAEADPQRLDEILREAGVRGGFDFEAWIEEARLRAAGKRVPVTRSRKVQIVRCPQDLSAVDGIGTVFEERLYQAGIGSYWTLAELPAEQLGEILGGQGVDLEGIKSSAMRLAVETNTQGRTWDGTPPDDFEILEGIGEIYERRLYEAGICTFAAMAAATPEQLADICKAPPMRTPDYAAWIATAAARSG